MKRLLGLVLLVVLSFALVGCGESETSATAYQIVHKDYVGVADIVVLDMVIQTLALEEYYLPNDWAKVVVGETAPEDVIVVSGSSSATWYGKYIVIGNKQFTGELRTEVLVIGEVTYSKQTVKYVATGVDDLFTWLKNSEANMSWYVEQLNADLAFVAKADWTASTYVSAGKGGWTKSTTGYWSGDQYPIGWPGNMNALKALYVGNSFDANASIVKNIETGFWSLGDAVSGATLTDFPDYHSLVGKAYSKAATK